LIPKYYHAPLSDTERKLILGFITQAQELHAVGLHVDLGCQVRNPGGIGEELSRALVRKRSRAGIDVFERDERRVGRRIVDREEILVLVVGVFLNICNTVGGRLGFLVFVWVDPAQRWAVWVTMADMIIIGSMRQSQPDRVRGEYLGQLYTALHKHRE